YPVLSSAVLTTSGTQVMGTLDSTAGATFVVEFFASPAADASGFGEGQTFLGSTNVTLNGSGTGSFSKLLGPTVTAANVVAATATSVGGNTSEFSQVIAVTATDADNDGLPNSWELFYFGSNTAATASLDSDGDGLT